MPLQWRNQIWQSLEEGAGKRCLECGGMHVGLRWAMSGCMHCAGHEGSVEGAEVSTA